MRPPAHAGTSLSVVLAGRVWERVGRADETGGPLSAVVKPAAAGVKPAGAGHEIRFGPEGARTLAFEFAPGFFDGMEDAPPRWRWRHGDAAARRALRLCRAAASDPGSSPGQALDDALALLL